MGVTDTYVLTPHLPGIDDEVILPIFLVQPRVHPCSAGSVRGFITWCRSSTVSVLMAE
jgi:hypothetical protein